MLNWRDHCGNTSTKLGSKIQVSCGNYVFIYNFGRFSRKSVANRLNKSNESTNVERKVLLKCISGTYFWQSTLASFFLVFFYLRNINGGCTKMILERFGRIIC